MQFLTKLAEEGNISEARRWRITDGFVNIGKFIAGLFKSKKTSGDDAATDPMKALGRAVALHILEKQNKKDVSKAAAILLLTALDIAYISVLAVSLTNTRSNQMLTCRSSRPLLTTCSKVLMIWRPEIRTALKTGSISKRRYHNKPRTSQKRMLSMPTSKTCFLKHKTRASNYHLSVRSSSQEALKLRSMVKRRLC